MHEWVPCSITSGRAIAGFHDPYHCRLEYGLDVFESILYLRVELEDSNVVDPEQQQIDPLLCGGTAILYHIDPSFFRDH